MQTSLPLERFTPASPYQRFQFLLRRAFWKAQGKTYLHFLHIGKTAGTTLKENLMFIGTTHKFRLIFHAHQMPLSKIPEGEKVACFLRHPGERFASGFYHHKREGAPVYHKKNSTSQKMGFLIFPELEDLVEGLFDSDPFRKELAYLTISANEHLARPLTFWFPSIKEIEDRKNDILFIGLQEHFNYDFERLRKLLVINKWPSEPQKLHSNPKGSSYAISPNTRCLLESFLEEDILIFNYLIKRFHPKGISKE